MNSRVMATLLLGAATAMLGPVGCKQGTRENAQATPAEGTGIGINTAWMDTSVKPGDDFYAYADGGWMKSTPIPADRSGVTASYLSFLQTEKQQQELLAAINKSNPAAGSNDAKIKDYYAAYMNTAAIDAAGLTPLKPDLDRYAAIKD
jgi:predicted metalloendopeptidase